MNFPPPPVLMRQNNRGVDVNWLWRNRDNPLYRREVIRKFLSPNIHADAKRMSSANKAELLHLRRTITKIYNIQRAGKRRKRVAMREALLDVNMVSELIDIMGRYI